MKTLIFRVEQAWTNGVTGHLTIHARIVERDGESEVQGVPETFGIDPIALDSQFGGDGEKWREWVKEQMLVKHQKRMKAYVQGHGWVGKEWPIDPPKST